jgi:hypothetical protein
MIFFQKAPPVLYNIASSSLSSNNWGYSVADLSLTTSTPILSSLLASANDRDAAATDVQVAVESSPLGQKPRISQNLIHGFSTKPICDMENLSKTFFFRTQTQCGPRPPSSGKEILQNRIDLLCRSPIMALSVFSLRQNQELAWQFPILNFRFAEMLT